MARATKVIEDEQLKHPTMRRMSVLERNRAALEFVKMNESPDNYLLHNRYLERGSLPGMDPNATPEEFGETMQSRESMQLAK